VPGVTPPGCSLLVLTVLAGPPGQNAVVLGRPSASRSCTQPQPQREGVKVNDWNPQPQHCSGYGRCEAGASGLFESLMERPPFLNFYFTAAFVRAVLVSLNWKYSSIRFISSCLKH
jgi:hypothetical protein